MDTDLASPKTPRWRTVLGTAWALLFGGVLVLMLVKLGGTSVDGYRSLTLGRVALNLPVIIATFLLAKLLMRLHPAFAWKASDLFLRKTGTPSADQSLLLVALRARFIGLLVAPLLVANLPVIALLEEFIFRQGTTDWRAAIWRSAAFGLAHLGMNVPFGASCAVGMTGFWFSYWYFRGGIELSGAMHLAYILPVVGLSLLGLILEAKKSRRP